MKRTISAFRMLVFCAFLPSGLLTAQSYLDATGNPSFSINIPVENGFINIANGNLHLEFPLATQKQRGALKLDERLVYDSRIWTIVNTGASSWQPSNVPNTPYVQAGWRLITGLEAGRTSHVLMQSSRLSCPNDLFNKYNVNTYIFRWSDSSGTLHTFDAVWNTDTSGEACNLSPQPESSSGWATDGSGYQINLDGDTSSFPTSVVVVDANGTQAYPQVTDRYGNYWSSDANGNLVDDLGRTPVIVTVNGNITYYDVLSPTGPINNNGTRVRYTVTTAPVQVSTQFNRSGVTEWSGTLNPVQNIQFPDGSSYSFTYDSYGELDNVTLPAGGVIKYEWDNMSDNALPSLYGNRWLRSRTLGNNPALTLAFSYTKPCPSGGPGCLALVLHRPSGDETAYKFMLANGVWDTNVSAYEGSATSGTPLVNVTNTYDLSNACQTVACSGAEYIKKSTVTTTLLDSNLTTQSQYLYNNPALGKITSLKQWDYYTGAPSSLPARETDFTYSSSGFDLTQMTEYDSGHNQVALTTYGYTTSATATSGLPQHGAANAGGPYLQTVSNWVNTAGNSLTTTYAMDDSGMVTSVTDSNGNKSTIAYQCSNALPYQATNALNQTTTYGYDCNSGAVTSIKDPNDSAANRSGTVYQYEGAGRVQSITYPDGGQISYSYPSAIEVDTSVLATPDPTITFQAISDSFGRPDQKVRAGVSSETTYDANGRVYCVTNPHLSTTSSTDGTVCMTYDGLDRPMVETEQDNNQLTWSYHGNSVTSTDEAGHSWQRTSNVFGNLTSVIEPGNLQTSYAYDGLGNLRTISQNGTSGDTPRTRSFTYDSLSRMLTSTTPESGTTTYSYLSNGALCAGDPSLPCSTTDARNIYVNYTYDALNRLTNRQSAGASGIPGFRDSFAYDSPTTGTGGAFASSNSIGRVVEAATGANTSEQYSYDAMGRIIVQANTLPSTCCDAASQVADEVKAQYDLAGNVTSLTYPDGRVVTQIFNNLGQMLTSTFDNYNGQHEGYTYAGGLTYTPAGAQAEIVLGNGVYIHTPYNNREQMCQVWSSGPSSQGSPVLVDTHIYYGSEIFCGNTPGNNGNISEVKDWRNQNRTRHFGYDSLNRITSFNTNDNTMQQGYTYDSFGNLMNQTGTLNPSFTIGTNNQLTSGGYGYDAAGNATSYDNNGTTSTLQFNAENKVVNFNSGAATYTYEATGSRARKDSNGTWAEYVTFNGKTLAERHQDGTWSDYIYANGQKIARADNYDVRIHFSGTNCSNCGPQAWAYALPIPQYVIQSGDKIAWRQYQDGPAVPRGGLAIAFTDGTNTNWNTQDQNGQAMNNDATQNAWDYRIADLSAYAGKTISGAWINEDTASGAGNWEEWFSDIAFYRTDGTVDPIYHRQTNVSYSGWGSSGVTNQKFEINVSPNLQWEMADNTTYYIGDQTGSVREEFGGEGWPVSSSVFYPFGVEQTATTDPNSYKFATLERDSESNLDHATFRQYTPLAGRWMSPDPSGLAFVDPANPQSLNPYTYVLNNPLISIDPSGLGCQSVTEVDYFAGKVQQIEGSVDTSDCFRPAFGVWLGPGSGGAGLVGGHGTAPSRNVNRTFSKTFKCGATPQQLESGVENNFWTLASYTGSGALISSYTLFAPAAIVPGQTVDITAGVTVGGSAIDAHNWQVTVGSVSPTSFTFNTVQGQHGFYPGAVTFSATSAGAGQLTFNVNVNATYANWGYWAGGKLYGETAEGNTWNNLISNVASFCSTIP